MGRSERVRSREAMGQADGQPGAADAKPVAAAGDTDGAIGQLLGASPEAPLERRPHPVWRERRWILAAAVLTALAAPAVYWVQYRVRHIISKNAAVRAHVAEIGTRSAGLVASVAVDVGDRVRAGQLLVQLADLHLRADVQEARAEVAGLRHAIEVERAAISMERVQNQRQGPEGVARIAAARAKAEGASIAAEDAKRIHEMQEALHARDGLVSSEALRIAESQRRAADARLNEARANAEVEARSVDRTARLAADEVTVRVRHIAVLEADLLAAQARLARAEADLESAVIRAPSDGAVLRRIAQPGAAIDAGQPVISMWLGQDLWVEAWIDEQDLGSVRRGSRATVTFHSFPNQEFRGHVDRIGLSTDLEIPEADVPQPRFTRMDGAPVVGVRIRLEQAPPALVPGLSAVVAIERQK